MREVGTPACLVSRHDIEGHSSCCNSIHPYVFDRNCRLCTYADRERNRLNMQIQYIYSADNLTCRESSEAEAGCLC
jgi:hypothetical protein